MQNATLGGETGISSWRHLNRPPSPSNFEPHTYVSGVWTQKYLDYGGPETDWRLALFATTLFQLRRDKDEVHAHQMGRTCILALLLTSRDARDRLWTSVEKLVPASTKADDAHQEPRRDGCWWCVLPPYVMPETTCPSFDDLSKARKLPLQPPFFQRFSLLLVLGRLVARVPCLESDGGRQRV